MRDLIATILIAGLAGSAMAQTTAAPDAKPAAKNHAKPAHVAAKRQAIEVDTPTEDFDPTDKLTPIELAIAKQVYTGVIPCELGEKVSIKPMRREGFFFVSRGIYRYVMRPVESRTGAIRLEDQQRGALWLQLGNKSMLMNQKEGKRLADECQSPEQVKFAEEMKSRPPVNILEPAPSTNPAATAAAPASPTQANAPAK